MERILWVLVFAFVFSIVVFIFQWSWNVFAVEVLNLKAVTFYQAFAGIFLVGSTFGAAKASLKSK